MKLYRGVVIGTSTVARRFGKQWQFEIVEGGEPVRSYRYFENRHEAEKAARDFLDAIMHKVRLDYSNTVIARRDR